MERFDVCIIGSGYGGAIPAARLSAGGMRVVVLERGARLSSRDFRQSGSLPYLQSITDYVVSSSNISFRMGKMVGGTSVLMDGAHYRCPSLSFDLRETPGGRRYWPAVYDRTLLDPYYRAAEAMLRVRQMSWNEISKAGGLFAKMLDSVGASCDRAPLNYTDCLQCGFCSQGCIYDKKQSLLFNYIPAAESRGAEFRPGCNALGIVPQGTEYAVRYVRDGRAAEILAPRVIVACGGIHTPALLLRSRTHLPNLGVAGDHVGDHFNSNGEHPFAGILPPEFDDLSSFFGYKGMDNAGLMSFHWLESEGFTLHAGAGFEPAALAADFKDPVNPVLPRRSFGLEYKRFVEGVYPHRLIGFTALGIATGFGRIVLRSDGTPDIVRANYAEYTAYLDRLERIVFDIGDRTGITILSAFPRAQAGQTSTHLLSSCRLSERREDGVVDPDCQVWGYPGLYITDSSVIPYAMAVNPALTISALAERAAETILRRG